MESILSPEHQDAGRKGHSLMYFSVLILIDLAYAWVSQPSEI